MVTLLQIVAFVLAVLGVVFIVMGLNICFEARPDGGAIIIAFIIGAVLFGFGLLSGAAARTLQRSEATARVEASCTVTVEGRRYHPNSVSFADGIGTMVLADGGKIQFLGGIVENCR